MDSEIVEHAHTSSGGYRRARPKKPHEPDPFLAVDRLTPEQMKEAIEQAQRIHRANTQPSLYRKPRPTTDNSLNPSKPYKLSSMGRLTPGSPSKLYRMSSMGCWTPSSPLLNLRPTSKMSSHGIPPFHPPNTTPKPNYHVKSPFKHAVDKPKVVQPLFTPDQDIKEKMFLATYHVRNVLAQPNPKEKPRVSGRLWKGRLKPLYPVKLDGPTIEQCRGIISEARPYSRSVSRAIKERRHKTIEHEHVSKNATLYNRPQTAESIHRTSIASSDLSDQDFGADLDDLDSLNDTQFSDDDNIVHSVYVGNDWQEKDEIKSNDDEDMKTSEDINSVDIPFEIGLGETLEDRIKETITEMEEYQNEMDEKLQPHAIVGRDATWRMSEKNADTVEKELGQFMGSNEFAEDKLVEDHFEHLQVTSGLACRPHFGDKRPKTAPDLQKNKMSSKSVRFADPTSKTELPSRKQSAKDSRASTAKSSRKGGMKSNTLKSSGFIELPTSQNESSVTDEKEKKKEKGNTAKTGKSRTTCKDFDDIEFKSDTNHDDDDKDVNKSFIVQGKNVNVNENTTASQTNQKNPQHSSNSENERKSTTNNMHTTNKSHNQNLYGSLSSKLSKLFCPNMHSQEIKARPQSANVARSEKVESSIRRRPSSAKAPFYANALNKVEMIAVENDTECNYQSPYSQIKKIPVAKGRSKQKVCNQKKNRNLEKTCKVQSFKFPDFVHMVKICKGCGMALPNIQAIDDASPVFCDVCKQQKQTKDLLMSSTKDLENLNSFIHSAKSTDTNVFSEDSTVFSMFCYSCGLSNDMCVCPSNVALPSHDIVAQKALSLTEIENALDGIQANIQSQVKDIENIDLLSCRSDVIDKPNNAEEQYLLRNLDTGTGNEKLIATFSYEKLLLEYRRMCLSGGDNCGAMSTSLVISKGPHSPKLAFCNTAWEKDVSGKFCLIQKRIPNIEHNAAITPEFIASDITYKYDKVSDSGIGSEIDQMEITYEADLKEFTSLFEMDCDELPPKDGADLDIQTYPRNDIKNLVVVAMVKELSKAKMQEDDSYQTASYPPLCFTINARPPTGYVYYFAYGADLNQTRVGTYIKRNNPSRIWGLLFGFQMKFNKQGIDKMAGSFANIEFNPYSSVEGVLYTLTTTEIKLLDHCLGYPEHFTHVILPVWICNSPDADQYGVAQYCVPALTYIAHDKWIIQDDKMLNFQYSLGQCMKGADMLTPAYKEHLLNNMAV